ncbi:proline-rich protein 29-like isoform X2 [Stegostoma tigrinum]|uniref:proline-rich protein 29-like isoform X2 n=1 Tax=Stegostoma tigrinum TaxID=3053191 RepID=UPI00202B765F|nr:proline-rich protein 29-like isoform X2 [Stegostoma tigrinum]
MRSMYFAENNLFSPQTWKQEPQRLWIIQQQIPQQPTTIFQDLSGPQHLQIPSIRNGHVKEDLIELMMIQNAQMHQVIMNNITMAALTSFGYSTQPQLAVQNPLSIRMEDSEPDTVYHHHYEPWPYAAFPSWSHQAQTQSQPQAHHMMRALQENLRPVVRHVSGDAPPSPRREIVLRCG